jgi:hypothetical protein
VNYMANISRYGSDPQILSAGPSSLTDSDRMARSIGWFSLALGAVELLAPRVLTRFLGIEGREGLLRAYGMREIGSGMMSLSTDKQVGLWSRVAGDGLDLATLVGAYRSDNPQRTNVGVAIGMVIGITMLDIVTGQMTTTVHARKPHEWRRYNDRSGFPGGVQQARGAARAKGGTGSA